MRIALIVALLSLPASAAPAHQVTKDELKKLLKQHPDIILDLIKENRKQVLESVSQAAQEEQARRQQEQEAAEKRELDASLKNPKAPEITEKTRIRGNREAKHTLIEYSDFQCSYCARGYHTVETLRKKYGADMRFIYKHLPLNFHPQAMPAAQYMEAASLQSPEKAWQFHDKLFENQDKLGEAFYHETAKELGLDLERLKADLQSQAVKDKIEADVQEAKRFGFTGTPGFLINGVPVRGAYPPEHFEQLIEKLGQQPKTP